MSHEVRLQLDKNFPTHVLEKEMQQTTRPACSIKNKLTPFGFQQLVPQLPSMKSEGSGVVNHSNEPEQALGPTNAQE